MSSIHKASPPTARNGRVAPSALSRHTAPPSKKHAVLWWVLAAIALGVVAATYARQGAGPALVGLVAVLAAAYAIRDTRWNATVYPELQQLWERSFMCTRCGEIFSV